MFFCEQRYTIPTFIKGRKQTLVVNDLYKVLKEHKSGKFYWFMFITF